MVSSGGGGGGAGAGAGQPVATNLKANYNASSGRHFSPKPVSHHRHRYNTATGAYACGYQDEGSIERHEGGNTAQKQ